MPIDPCYNTELALSRIFANMELRKQAKSDERRKAEDAKLAKAKSYWWLAESQTDEEPETKSE